MLDKSFAPQLVCGQQARINQCMRGVAAGVAHIIVVQQRCVCLVLQSSRSCILLDNRQSAEMQYMSELQNGMEL